MKEIKVFSGRSHSELAEEIRQKLEIPLSKVAFKEYSSGCFEIILEEDVANKPVIIIQTSLPDSLEKHIWELFEIASFAKSCGASEITAVMPYASYSRSDKAHDKGMGIAAELFAKLLEQSGITRIIGIDFHSDKFESFFSCKVHHLSAVDLLSDYLNKKNLNNSVVLAPDRGALKKGLALAQKLNVPLAEVEKKRISNTEVRIESITGDFVGKQVIIFDDEIATGGTLKTLAEEVLSKGAESIIFAVTHGLFTGDAVNRFSNINNLKEIVVTNTIPIKKEVKESLPITVLSVSDLLAEEIKRFLYL